MEEKEKKNNIAELTEQIVSNAKDAHWMRNQVTKLLRLQKQADDMNKEIDVPISEVLETVSFGNTEVSKTIRGYLFKTTYHSGQWTFIGSQFGGVCAMLQMAMDCQKAIDENKGFDGCAEYIEAVECVFQSPLFAAMGWNLLMIGKEISFDSLLNISNDIKKEVNRFSEEHGNPTEPRQETPEDIKENIEMENMGRVVETLANAPLPPEDNE